MLNERILGDIAAIVGRGRYVREMTDLALAEQVADAVRLAMDSAVSAAADTRLAEVQAEPEKFGLQVLDEPPVTMPPEVPSPDAPSPEKPL